MHRLLTSLLLLSLLASPAFALPPATPATTVVCFGDSLTAGTGGEPGGAYPDFLRRSLAADGYSATVLNQGVAGNTTKDGLERISQVLAASPAIVVLELGANDAIYRLPPAETQTRLQTMIEQFQAAHIRVVLAGIRLPDHLPNGPSPVYLSQFNAIYPALAAKYQLAYIPWLLDGAYGVPGSMSSDYIHPNSTGYRRVAANVLPVLEPLLAAQATR